MFQSYSDRIEAVFVAYDLFKKATESLKIGSMSEALPAFQSCYQIRYMSFATKWRNHLTFAFVTNYIYQVLSYRKHLNTGYSTSVYQTILCSVFFVKTIWVIAWMVGLWTQSKTENYVTTLELIPCIWLNDDGIQRAVIYTESSLNTSVSIKLSLDQKCLSHKSDPFAIQKLD